MDRTKCATLVPKSHLSQVPKEGDHIIYFGAGHLEAVQQEEKEYNQFKIDSSSFLVNLESYVSDYRFYLFICIFFFILFYFFKSIYFTQIFFSWLFAWKKNIIAIV